MFENCLRSAAAVGALLALLSGAALAAEFKPYGRGSFEKLREQHVGRPFVVHFWSVTCPSCLAELADWAKIADKRKAIEIVFVNTDPDNDHPRAQNRVDKAGLSNLVQYGFADDFVERLYFEADRSWRGELPFTALIGADGALVTVTGTIDDPLIADWFGRAGK